MQFTMQVLPFLQRLDARFGVKIQFQINSHYRHFPALHVCPAQHFQKISTFTKILTGAFAEHLEGLVHGTAVVGTRVVGTLVVGARVVGM